MGTSRGSNNPDPKTYEAPAPVQASPSQTLLDTRNQNIIKGLDSGKDWTTISELNPQLDLYNASTANNQNYAGEGLLSPNAFSGGNSQQLGLIAQQIANRRKQQAAGDAYNSVMNAQQQATGGLQWGAGMDNSRNMGNAQLQNQRYTSIWNRPKQPSLWGDIIRGAAGIGGAAISAGGF